MRQLKFYVRFHSGEFISDPFTIFEREGRFIANSNASSFLIESKYNIDWLHIFRVCRTCSTRKDHCEHHYFAEFYNEVSATHNNCEHSLIFLHCIGIPGSE